MKILIMAGGKGSRLGGVDKASLEVCGEPLLSRVAREARRLEDIDEILVAVTNEYSDAASIARSLGLEVITTSGMGYPQDLREALLRVGFPTLTLPTDLPFITKELIQDFLKEAAKSDASVVTLISQRHCFPDPLKGEASPVGIAYFRSMRGDWENVYMCRYPELLDIDTFLELTYAKELCSRGGARK